MTSEQIKNSISQYKNRAKELGYEPALEDFEGFDLESLKQNENNIPKKYAKDIDLIKKGDYSNFQALPLFLRNYYGTLEVEKFREHFFNKICTENEQFQQLSQQDPPITSYKQLSGNQKTQFEEYCSLNNEDVKKYLQEQATNAVFRAGMTAGRQNHPEKARMDEYMSRYLFEKMMMPPNDEERQRLVDTLGSEKKAEAAITQNLVKQQVLAKTVFMAQLGDYIVKTSDQEQSRYQGSITETLVHGGRTNVILPHGGDQEAVMDSFISQKDVKEADVYKRIAASHYASRRKVPVQGVISKDTKESGPKSIGDYFTKQYGMDFAAGGLGSIGPNQKAVLADGRAGHMYLRKELGDDKHCGSLLIGFESCASLKTSLTGHTHTPAAKSSKQSSFLTNKGGVGRKNDGRTVDLSAMSPEDFTALMNAFSEKYAELQQGANTNEGRERLQKFNEALCGNRLQAEQLKELLTGIGMEANLVNRAVDSARAGRDALESKFNPATITTEQYENMFRKEIKAEDACKMAEDRVRTSVSCEQAVGAIKELQKIHNMRSFGWKLLHPILNYREKNAVKNLIGELYRDGGKKFGAVDIHKEFLSDKDTYMLDYGKGLNNYKGINQLNVHKNKFLKAQSMDEDLKAQFTELAEYARDLIAKRQMKDNVSDLENAKIGKAAKDTQKLIDHDNTPIERRAEQDVNMIQNDIDDLQMNDRDGLVEDGLYERESISVGAAEMRDGGKIIEKYEPGFSQPNLGKRGP